MHAAKCCCLRCADNRCRRTACIFMTERHGPLLVLATAHHDAARSQITLGRLVIIIIIAFVYQMIFLFSLHMPKPPPSIPL